MSRDDRGGEESEKESVKYCGVWKLKLAQITHIYISQRHQALPPLVLRCRELWTLISTPSSGFPSMHLRACCASRELWNSTNPYPFSGGRNYSYEGLPFSTLPALPAAWEVWTS